LNSQRVFALVKKHVKGTVREPATLFMIILFPLILTLAFGTSFGAIGGSQSITYQIGIVNKDSAGFYSRWSNYFVQNLTYTKIVNVKIYPNNQTAQSDLSQGKLQAIIIIPEDFGRSCTSYWIAAHPSLWVNTTLRLYLDAGSIFATQVITPLVQQALINTIFGTTQTSVQLPVKITDPSLISSEKQSMFAFMAPGLFTFSSIFLIMIVAQSFTTERETGLLQRINTTPTTPLEFMTSHVLYNMIIALVQVAIIFLMAFTVGYRPKGDIFALAFGFLLVSIFALCNVGFGLITATIAKSSGAATGLAFVFIIPQMFLGTFVGYALSDIAQKAGMFVPSYYVTDALTSIFTRGASILSTTVLIDFSIVLACSIIILLIGIVLFRKYGKGS
jgi:ABC-2 type transport system permease protein